MLVERGRRVMNRHGDKKNTKKKPFKIWVHTKYVSRSEQTSCLTESMPMLPKGNAGTKHCTPKHLRATALPLSHVSCTVFMQVRGWTWEGGGSPADLCTKSMEEESVCVKHCMNESHLTAGDSPAFLPLFIFLLVTQADNTLFLVYAREITIATQKICRSNLQFN